MQLSRAAHKLFEDFFCQRGHCNRQDFPEIEIYGLAQTDAEVAADLEYETHILRPPTSLRFGLLDRVTLLASSIGMDELRAHATIGAAARSAVAKDRRLASYQRAGLEVTDPQLSAVDATHLQPVAGLVGNARRSTASAAQAIDQMPGSVLLVEAFEIG